MVEPISVAVHSLRDVSGVIASTSYVIMSLRVSNIFRAMLVHLGFKIALEKNSRFVKYGERCGHPISPRKVMTCPGNSAFTNASDWLDAWACYAIFHIFGGANMLGCTFEFKYKIFSHLDQIIVTLSPLQTGEEIIKLNLSLQQHFLGL